MYHINRVAVHQRLLVEFFCDFHEILSFEFILVTLLVFVTSGCHNTWRDEETRAVAQRNITSLLWINIWHRL